MEGDHLTQSQRRGLLADGAHDSSIESPDLLSHGNITDGPPVQNESRIGAETLQDIAGLGIGIGSLFTELLLSHPCIVLRRQCQVNHRSQWYHLTPFTLLPVATTLQRHQGVGTLWKGITSTFVLRGLTLASETAISEVSDFPREVSRYSSLKRVGEHILLKCLVSASITSFYSASLVETVQSEIASDPPGLLDCIKEGITRVVRWGHPQTTRMLPIWVLIPPTVLFSVLRYVIYSVVQHHVTSTKKREFRLKEQYAPVSSSLGKIQLEETFYSELIGSFMGHLWSDMLLYPLETVLHRLHLQGTRTIIDNLDYGNEVIPINTRYEGFFDCYMTIIREEGVAGLYKGFGALLLQYAVHVAVLRLTKMLFDKLIENFKSPWPPRPPVHKAQQRFPQHLYH